MLTLTRKEGESFYLYPDESLDPNMTIQELFDKPIRIELHWIETRSVARIKIDAPASIKIAREELC